MSKVITGSHLDSVAKIDRYIFITGSHLDSVAKIDRYIYIYFELYNFIFTHVHVITVNIYIQLGVLLEQTMRQEMYRGHTETSHGSGQHPISRDHTSPGPCSSPM